MQLAPQDMVNVLSFQLESDRPIEAISEEVAASCASFNFALLQTYVYHEIVESKGFPIQRKVLIYEICQAKVAASLLTSYPYFSLFMPCKIVLYEENGKSIVSTLNMDPILEILKEDLSIFQETQALFGQLKVLLAQLAGNE